MMETMTFPEQQSNDNGRDEEEKTASSDETSKRIPWVKMSCFAVLLIAFWFVQQKGENDGKFHMAVWYALRKHKPSLRIYRSLFEISLLLWATVMSLSVWYRYVGKEMVSDLLFEKAPPPTATSFSLCGSLFGSRDHESEQESEQDQMEQESEMQAEVAASPMVSTITQDFEGDDTTQQQGDNAPTVLSVVGAALDVQLAILVSLFLYTITFAETESMEQYGGLSTIPDVLNIAAPVFPLLLLLYFVIGLLFPWSKRRDGWVILSWTIGAPFYPVTFRDGFIGDILTSSVRPAQDLAFTCFYLFSGLQGWWSKSYFQEAIQEQTESLPSMPVPASLPPIESSWVLRTIVLPMCMVSPLWWRYMQNLRQTHDNKKRWPYLGNAFKYFFAAEVAMFGVFDPTKKEQIIWLSAFVLATLYQVWWDIFMDWELLERVHHTDTTNEDDFHISHSSDDPRIKTSTTKTSAWPKFRLRKKRLYPWPSFYWTICIINFILRFGWILTFMPSSYLDKTGILSNTFQGDWSSILNACLAAAEIMRRSLWGLIRLELEAIKVARTKGLDTKEDQDAFGTNNWITTAITPSATPTKEVEMRELLSTSEDEIFMSMDMQPMKVDDNSSGITFRQGIPYLKKMTLPTMDDMQTMNQGQILMELGVYATVFMLLGLIAAIHRMTL